MSAVIFEQTQAHQQTNVLPQHMSNPPPPQQQPSMTLGVLLQVCNKLIGVPINNIQLLLQHDIPNQCAAVEAGLNTAVHTYPHLTEQLQPYIQRITQKKIQIDILLQQTQLQQRLLNQSHNQQQSNHPLNHHQQQQQQYNQQQHRQTIPVQSHLSPHSIQSQSPQTMKLQPSIPAVTPLPAVQPQTQHTSQVDLNKLMFHEPGNRYIKIRKLRATLFGNVTLFKDTHTDTLVAVKLSNKELMAKRVTSKGKPVSENPLDEMIYMRQLNAPLNNSLQHNSSLLAGSKYVLRLLDECDDGINIWTVLEFAQEGELFDYVESCDGRLDPDLVRRLFIEMVQGVQYMHTQGVCHLDLSLENLLLTGDHDMPDLKICDFGLARFIQCQTINGVQHELPYSPAVGTKPGKLGYMSPEVFAGLPFSGTISDVWSMGVILFILLTGVPPYEVPSTSDGRFAMIINPAHGVSTLLQRWNMLDKLSVDALDLVNRMLATPDRRITVQQIMQHPYVTKQK